MKKYRRVHKIGEGQYANVYEGIDLDTKATIAIKKIKITQLEMGLDISAIREIKILQEQRHPNIVELIDVFMTKSNLTLILEYLTSDLEKLINDKSIVFSNADIKSWLQMILNGIGHLHAQFILHRDLKPNNLLIAPNGVLKIADFGLARDFAATGTLMTPTVVTRWYRAPELLYGARKYGTGIDLWSIGCIFAELMLRTPFLPGETDIGQLNLIIKALGPPSIKEWPELVNLETHSIAPFSQTENSVENQKREFCSLFIAAGPDEIDIVFSMLRYNPALRPTANEALKSKYFQKMPLPTIPENLPKISAPVKSGLRKGY